MSMSDLFPSGPGRPAAPPRPAELVLSALAEAAISRRAEIGACCDCALAGRLCEDHALDLDLARQYEALYAQVTAGASWWAHLAIAMTAGAN